MDGTEFEELAGRIDGVAQAVLRIAAELETAQLIRGSRLAKSWRGARPKALATGRRLQASHRVLQQLAGELDAARAGRLSAQLTQPCGLPC